MKSGKEYENEVEVEAPNCKRNPNSKLKTKIETNWPAPAMDCMSMWEAQMEKGQREMPAGESLEWGNIAQTLQRCSRRWTFKWVTYFFVLPDSMTSGLTRPATSNQQRENGQTGNGGEWQVAVENFKSMPSGQSVVIICCCLWQNTNTVRPRILIEVSEWQRG